MPWIDSPRNPIGLAPASPHYDGTLPLTGVSRKHV